MTTSFLRTVLGACASMSIFAVFTTNVYADDHHPGDRSLASIVTRGIVRHASEDADTTLDEIEEQNKFERSFEIPDTPMRIRFFGYVSGTGVFDIADEGAQDTIIASTSGTLSPTQGDGHFRLAASRTNWGFEVRTPVPGYCDPLKLVIIAGYSPLASAASEAQRLEHVKQLLSNNEANIIAAAYVEGFGCLAGQYATNFMDINLIPELLNYGGNAGAYGIAAPQFRYTYKFGCHCNNAIAVSIENPQTDYTLLNAVNLVSVVPNPAAPGVPILDTIEYPPVGLGGPFYASGLPSVLLRDPVTHDRVPDVVLSFKSLQNWGHVFASAMVRELRVSGKPIVDEIPAVTGSGVPGLGLGFPADIQKQVDAHAYAYAFNVAGKYRFCNKDNLNGHVQFGYGMGRYAINTTTQTAWIDLNDPEKIHRLYSWVGDIAYQHYWTEHLRSTFLYGFVCNNTNESTPRVINKWIHSFVANVMYAPVPIVRVGVEYIYQKRTFVGDPIELGMPKDGNISRIEAQARLYF